MSLSEVTQCTLDVTLGILEVTLGILEVTFSTLEVTIGTLEVALGINTRCKIDKLYPEKHRNWSESKSLTRRSRHLVAAGDTKSAPTPPTAA